MNSLKHSHGHQLDRHSSLWNNQNELKIRAPPLGALCLDFLIGESGAAVLLLRGGRFTLTRENLFRGKVGSQLENGKRMWNGSKWPNETK